MSRLEHIKNEVKSLTVEELKAIIEHRTEDYFRERAERGDVKRARQILKRAGRGNPPRPVDELR